MQYDNKSLKLIIKFRRKKVLKFLETGYMISSSSAHPYSLLSRSDLFAAVKGREKRKRKKEDGIYFYLFLYNVRFY